MPRRDQGLKDMQTGFAGGLNTIGDPSMLRPDQAFQLINTRLTSYGAATKRLGTRYTSTATLSSGVSPKWGVYWPSQRVALVNDGTTIYKADLTVVSNSLTWSDITPAQSGYTQYLGFGPALVPFVNAGGAEVLFGSNGASFGYYTVGGWVGISAVVTLGIGCTGLTVYNSRLWGWRSGLVHSGSFTWNNTAGASNALYYSALDNGETFGIAASGGGQINVVSNGKSPLVACFPCGASLLLLQQNGVSRLSGFGQDDISVLPQGISSVVGCIAQNAADAYDNVVYFLSPRGLYWATESSIDSVNTPDRPDPTIPILADTACTQAASIVRVNPATREVYVFLSYGASSGTYVYNIDLGAWSGPFTGPPYGSASQLTPLFLPVRDSTKRAVMFGNTVTAAQVTQLDVPGVYKDDVAAAGTGGSAFTATIQCHRMFAGDRVYSKAWRWITIMCDLDDTTNGFTVISSALRGGISTKSVTVASTAQNVYYVGPGGVGPYLDVTITDAGVSASQYASVGVEGFFLGQR